MPNTIGYIEEGKKRAKKNMDIELHGVWGRSTPTPLEPEVFTPAGWPACSTPVLRMLAGKPGAAKRALAELEGADLSSSSEGAGCLASYSKCTQCQCASLMISHRFLDLKPDLF